MEEKKNMTQSNKKKILEVLKILVCFCIIYSVGTLFQYCILLIPLVKCFLDNESIKNIYLLLDSSYMSSLMNSFPAWFDFIMLFSTLGVVAAVFLYCKEYQKKQWKDLRIKKKNILSKYIKGYVIGSIFIIVMMCINYMFGSIVSYSNINNVNYVMIVALFVGYIIQGFSEELLCRGYFLMTLVEKTNKYVALFISAIMFSLLHSFNNGVTIISFVNLFLFGIYIGIVLLKTDNLIICAAIHSAWNFVQGNVYGVYVSGIEPKDSIIISKADGIKMLSGGEFGLEGSVIATFVLLCAIVIASTTFGGKLLKKL